MKKILLRSLALLGVASAAQSQTINVTFSHYGGKEYVYVLEKGSKKDTIISGMLDAEGKAALVIPSSYKDYAGISHFKLKQGGGMDFIVNKENFSISCTEEQPTFENTKYTNSPENTYFNERMKKQGEIVKKERYVHYGLDTYKKGDALYEALSREQQNLNQQFNALKTEASGSKLYAVKLAEIYDFLMGVAGTFDMTQEQKARQANIFVKDQVDMTTVYTSGQWDKFIEAWLSLHQDFIKDDTALLADIKQTLSRIKSNEIYTAFVEKTVLVLNQSGKDDLVNKVSQYASKSGRLEKPGQKLINTINGPVIGALAPALQTANGKKLINKKTMIFFYESGCNNCENEIHQLMGNYEILKEKGYEIISVAADMTKDAAGHSHDLPWKDQLCDYKGFAGPNFKTYAIMGTPTFFITDQKGKITGRYARLVDTGILNNSYTLDKE